MKRQGYEVKHELSSGVKGSDEAALEILRRPWRTTVHYCTSGYKDGWQLRSRIKRRAENVARPWDVVTEDGTLLKGVIEGDGLDEVMRDLSRTHGVPEDLMGLDGARRRLEVAPWILEELAARLGRRSYLFEGAHRRAPLLGPRHAHDAVPLLAVLAPGDVGGPDGPPADRARVDVVRAERPLAEGAHLRVVRGHRAAARGAHRDPPG